MIAVSPLASLLAAFDPQTAGSPPAAATVAAKGQADVGLEPVADIFLQMLQAFQAAPAADIDKAAEDTAGWAVPAGDPGAAKPDPQRAGKLRVPPGVTPGTLPVPVQLADIAPLPPPVPAPPVPAPREGLAAGTECAAGGPVQPPVTASAGVAYEVTVEVAARFTSDVPVSVVLSREIVPDFQPDRVPPPSSAAPGEREKVGVERGGAWDLAGLPISSARLPASTPIEDEQVAAPSGAAPEAAPPAAVELKFAAVEPEHSVEPVPSFVPLTNPVTPTGIKSEIREHPVVVFPPETGTPQPDAPTGTEPAVPLSTIEEAPPVESPGADVRPRGETRSSFAPEGSPVMPAAWEEPAQPRTPPGTAASRVVRDSGAAAETARPLIDDAPDRIPATVPPLDTQPKVDDAPDGEPMTHERPSSPDIRGDEAREPSPSVDRQDRGAQPRFPSPRNPLTAMVIPARLDAAQLPPPAPLSPEPSAAIPAEVVLPDAFPIQSPQIANVPKSTPSGSRKSTQTWIAEFWGAAPWNRPSEEAPVTAELSPKRSEAPVRQPVDAPPQPVAPLPPRGLDNAVEVPAAFDTPQLASRKPVLAFGARLAEIPPPETQRDVPPVSKAAPVTGESADPAAEPQAAPQPQAATQPRQPVLRPDRREAALSRDRSPDESGPLVSKVAATTAQPAATAPTASNPRAEEPGPPLPRKADATPLAAEPEVVANASPKPAAVAKEIQLEVGGGPDRVQVRLTERAGEVHVAVRTPDHRLAGDLREGLPQLSSRLEAHGIRATEWHTTGASGTDRRFEGGEPAGNGRDGAERNGGGRGQRDADSPPRRFEDPEEERNRNQKGRSFAWLMSSLQ